MPSRRCVVGRWECVRTISDALKAKFGADFLKARNSKDSVRLYRKYQLFSKSQGTVSFAPSYSRCSCMRYSLTGHINRCWREGDQPRRSHDNWTILELDDGITSECDCQRHPPAKLTMKEFIQTAIREISKDFDREIEHIAKLNRDARHAWHHVKAIRCLPLPEHLQRLILQHLAEVTNATFYEEVIFDNPIEFAQ